MNKNKTVIIIPTYNEIDNCKIIYKKIRKILKKIHIIFVDDNSPDGTGMAIKKMQKKDKILFLKERENKLGIGSAHKDGIKWAIKQKYNFQSYKKIKDYNLDLNSRLFSKNSKQIKLTQREIDIILYLFERSIPQSINDLQDKVWRYSLDLETHTVETHVYRLRKKIKDKFDDDSFIISHENGYLI